MELDDWLKLPPVVLFTSEFDFQRNKCLDLIKDLKSALKYIR